MQAVLADIGGTHIRLGLHDGDDNTLRLTEKYPVAGWPSLIAALEEYKGKHGLADVNRLAIATAAWPHKDGKWRFAHPDRWVIDKHELTRAGWNLAHIGNDFAVSARGCVSLPQEDLQIIKEVQGEPFGDRKIIMGPGTGLGLAYAQTRNGQTDIQETFGGHMICPAISYEQHTVLKLVERIKDSPASLVAEDIISGPGLLQLYKAVALMDGQTDPPMPENAAALFIAARHDPVFVKTLRLFHEFLGLLAHQAALFGHAYAGIYLDGGLIHQLLSHGLFETETFVKSLILNPVPVVREKLESMPVYAVSDPYIALRGLQDIIRRQP